VATTVYAARCNELKNRYTTNAKSKESSFVTQYNALWALSNLGRLSRMNCIWLGKRVIEMIEHWSDQDQREMLDRLQDRQARAWKRWEARIAAKQAAKTAGATTKGRARARARKETSVLAPPAPENDSWNLV
jgi:hypothetical protein